MQLAIGGFEFGNFFENLLQIYFTNMFWSKIRCWILATAIQFLDIHKKSLV